MSSYPTPLPAEFLSQQEASEKVSGHEKRFTPTQSSTDDTRLPTLPRSCGPVLEISHSLSDYEVVEDIGRGQFGVVQKIKLKGQTTRLLVWKKIKYSQMHEPEKRQLTQEVQLLQALSHPNVVRYVGKINDRAAAVLYLIMEFCDGGDLARYLGHTVKKGHYLPEELILNWFRQLVDALHYCHHRPAGKVLHRDLKPQNILLSGKYKKLKLADFGLAKMLQPSQVMAQTHVGTPYYMSPEVLGRFKYDEKSDIWSLGCLVYEISTGLSPFSRASSYDDLCKLVEEGALQDEEFPEIYDAELFNTIKWMLSYNPQDRPTTDDLCDSVLYKWASALRFRDLSEFFRDVIQEQKRQICNKNTEILSLKRQLEEVNHDLQFFEEYIKFQRESDAAIRRSLRLVMRTTGLPQTETCMHRASRESSVCANGTHTNTMDNCAEDANVVDCSVKNKQKNQDEFPVLVKSTSLTDKYSNGEHAPNKFVDIKR